MSDASGRVRAAPALRPSDDDRERLVAQLREHFAADRLTAEEFSERVSGVYAAVTLAELDEATRDLPDLTSSRKEALAREVGRWAVHGWRIESHSDFSAVLVSGSNPNHLLHGLLTLFTVFWGLVWIAVALAGGERRVLLEVDELGTIRVEKAAS